ncbi:MAG: beta-ketoacyl synthase N-terminal-like domain-containing protein [Ruminiclostridium sp.]
MINLFDFDKVEKNRKMNDFDIAIIGASVHLPMADNLEELRDILRNKVDCIRDIPQVRREHAINYLRTQQGVKEIAFQKCGYLEDIDLFDFEFFKITPKEARLMNPYQRNLLTAAYEALDDAGYAGDDIRGSETGVFVGYIDLDGYKYMDMILNTQTVDDIDMAAIGNLDSMIPSRIAYYLDLKGPGMLIDTACSSSLVALHEACNAIRNQDCRQALVMSARLNLLPVENGVRLGMESDHQVVRTFDAQADGTAKGEGVIAYFLKAFHQAIEDKDQIYAVIKGSAVNHDGTTMGITAPNAQAQSEVLQKAWVRSEINPEDIECFEAHGTATKLGDVIEVEGITKAFSKYTDKLQFCAISSIKSNIGHLYDCSALAGLAKCILQLKYKELLPGTNFEIPNPKIDFEKSPVYVNNEYHTWSSHLPRRLCAVSSFGFSGTNCHVVLEEAPLIASDFMNTSQAYLLCISAYSLDLLMVTIKNYYSHIENSQPCELENICYTINDRKQHFSKRLAVLFQNREDLLRGLKGLVVQYNNDLEKGIIYQPELLSLGDFKDVPNYLTLKEAADSYMKGYTVNWLKIYNTEKVQKVRVPLTPMNQRHCWLNFSNCAVRSGPEAWDSREAAADTVKKEKTQQEKTLAYDTVIANITDIAKDLLGLEELSPDTNLLDIGVDSILYTKLHKRIDDIYPDILSISKMFVYPTIVQLARYICAEGGSGTDAADGMAAGELDDLDQLLKDFLEEK